MKISSSVAGLLLCIWLHLLCFCVASGTNLVRVNLPFPGKVQNVLVREGDVVKAGSVCFVMEAMKMLTDIRVPSTEDNQGYQFKVTGVFVSEGDLVKAGQLAATLQLQRY